MFFESIDFFAVHWFGSLEAFAISLLGILAIVYLLRVAWITLSDVGRMDSKAIAKQSNPNSYTGSSTAG